MVREIDTPHGPARAHLHLAPAPVGALVLGHAVGGGVGAPDLVAATAAGLACDWSVALVEQPYRVAGRRMPAPAAQLDVAWTAVIAALRAAELRDMPLVVGGRSSGARVACRTAEAVGAIAVLCLAFPLLPPGSSAAKSRQPELDAVTVPVFIVQGADDPFGMPAATFTREVVTVAGTHSLGGAAPDVAAAVAAWLPRLVAAS